jgi:hypothetical protein
MSKQAEPKTMPDEFYLVSMQDVPLSFVRDTCSVHATLQEALAEAFNESESNPAIIYECTRKALVTA